MTERLPDTNQLTTVNPMRYASPVNRDPKIPDLVNLVEASEILAISKQAVKKRADAGTLPGARVGPGWVFRRVVVEAIRDADQTKDESE